MGSFIRWLVLAWCLIVVCQGQLTNLRPLKGMLNDFDGRRNATEEREDALPQQPRPLASLPQAHSVQAHQRVVPMEQESELDDSVSDVIVVAMEQESELDDSVSDGIVVAMEQESEQNKRSRSKSELSLTSRFQAAFRKADEEAVEASCVGRVLIEATKNRTAKLQEEGLNFIEAVKFLNNNPVDKKSCEEKLKEVKEVKCEDFKEPKSCSETEPYRRMDGSCNNLLNPKWGKSMIPFTRMFYPAYENDIDAMRGEGREYGNKQLPSARTVSYKLQKIRKNPPLPGITLMVMQWGQFVDHDITFTAETEIMKRKARTVPTTISKKIPIKDQCPSDLAKEESDTEPLECCPGGAGNPVDDHKLIDCRPIDVSGDPLFQSENHTCMRFIRSLIASRGCVYGPREQLNQITSYIDGSAVYGSTKKVSDVLRTKKKGGLQKTEKGNLLPKNCCEDETFHCFKAGDTRVNEQPGLTSVHTLWLRVHEQLVTDFASENPHWNDETLFQEARRVVIALIQQTTFREFLPLVVGVVGFKETKYFDLNLLPNGPGLTYDPKEDASIANVIATAAFRFGHTLVNDALRASGGESVPLVGNFQNAKLLFQDKTRPSAFLEGLASSNSQAPDASLVLTLTNKLFAEPGKRIGLDLMSLNIQRGRDHGLPAYNTWRKACEFETFTSFDELSTVMPMDVVQVFKDTYSDVDEIDLFPASLSEFPVEGGLVGPTFACLLGQQFHRLKRGDRFFFQNMMQPKPFTPDQLASIKGLRLSAIICQHSDIQSLQPNVFQTAGFNGNHLQPCSSYPTLNTGLWKEKDMPPPGIMNCRGVGPFRGRKELDHWCTINCFHVPSFCPPTHCFCKPGPNSRGSFT